MPKIDRSHKKSYDAEELKLFDICLKEYSNICLIMGQRKKILAVRLVPGSIQTAFWAATPAFDRIKAKETLDRELAAILIRNIVTDRLAFERACRTGGAVESWLNLFEIGGTGLHILLPRSRQTQEVTTLHTVYADVEGFDTRMLQLHRWATVTPYVKVTGLDERDGDFHFRAEYSPPQIEEGPWKPHKGREEKGEIQYRVTVAKKDVAVARRLQFSIRKKDEEGKHSFGVTITTNRTEAIYSGKLEREINIIATIKKIMDAVAERTIDDSSMKQLMAFL